MLRQSPDYGMSLFRNSVDATKTSSFSPAPLHRRRSRYNWRQLMMMDEASLPGIM
jgi:hypothetical protein